MLFLHFVTDHLRSTQWNDSSDHVAEHIITPTKHQIESNETQEA